MKAVYHNSLYMHQKELHYTGLYTIVLYYIYCTIMENYFFLNSR